VSERRYWATAVYRDVEDAERRRRLVLWGVPLGLAVGWVGNVFHQDRPWFDRLEYLLALVIFAALFTHILRGVRFIQEGDDPDINQEEPR